MLKTWKVKKGEEIQALCFDFLSDHELRYAINWRFDWLKQGYEIL